VEDNEKQSGQGGKGEEEKKKKNKSRTELSPWAEHDPFQRHVGSKPEGEEETRTVEGRGEASP
jgi:hypothetical protein